MMAPFLPAGIPPGTPLAYMVLLRDTTLGIDFGTSNSAMAARRAGGAVQAITLEGDAHAMPTALFFNAEEHSTHYGRDAVAQYLAGTEGRLMRSLKSLLGSSLLQEQTAVHGRMVSYQDIIGLFLQRLAAQARAALGGMPQHVRLGRPVHFVDDDPARDRQAEDALRRAALDAGFAEVSFLPEPIAAALDYERRVQRETLALVVDIGGGTSDFTVVRLGPGRGAQTERASDILATTGVHVGGTDFDRKLNLALAMPLLGLGHAGPTGRPVPSGVFHDLATWHLIQWRYAPQALREARALRHDYRDPLLHARLMTVLEQRLGHRLADAVERGKIAASASASAAAAPLALDWIEPGLATHITPAGLAEYLAGPLEQVVACAQDCVRRAGLGGKHLDALYLTGGSSALRTLRQALALAFPHTPQVEGDLFGGVAAGLAVSAAHYS